MLFYLCYTVYVGGQPTFINHLGKLIMNDCYFEGRLVKEPKLLDAPGKKPVCYFTLKRDEYAGQDSDGTRTREVAIPFTSFTGQAKAIAAHARVGDQLFVHYRVENNVREKNGVTEYGFSFIVEKFDFGAPGQLKRAELAQSQG
jgi:single-strand DNA-binding protein